MKLGFIYDAVYPWLKGGGEKTLYELACRLRDRGHECHFFGMQLWDGPVDLVREGLYYHGLAPNVPLYGPDGKRRVGQTLTFARGLLRNLPRYDLASFDLFDVHAFPFLSFPAFQWVRKRRMPDVPWLLTWLEVWGSDYWRRYLGWKGVVGTQFERYCAAAAPHHLCISPTTGRRLHDLLGVDESRISVIPRGFAPPTISFTQPRDAHRVVVAGRLLSYKRVGLLLRAWPEVVRAVPDAILEIIGDGPERAALERLAQKLNLGDGVRFVGQLPEFADVLAKIASAGLLLQPSAREGQSTVVLEALSVGTPVLAATGAETAVGDFLGPPSITAAARLDVAAGPDAWSARIIELLRDDDLRNRLAAAGRESVAQLGWDDQIAPQIEAMYLRLISESRSGISGA